MDKIFISHSTKDLKIVKLFVEQILKLGLDIPSDRIFCSSMEGHGVKSGEYIPDRLKEEMNRSCIAILFISNNYKESEVCLNEVGAAWLKLNKTQIIPLLLPKIGFDKLGFLDTGRLGLKIEDEKDLYKLIQDNRNELNPDFNLQLINDHIAEFLKQLAPFSQSTKVKSKKASKENLEISEFQDCFTNTLEPYNDVLNKSLPVYPIGIHEVMNDKLKIDLIQNLSQTSFLKSLWYKHSGGDYYVQSLKQLPTGNWLLGDHWELKITDIWVCKEYEYQNNFILIKSEKLPSFQYQTDAGGNGNYAGILEDGTIVSEVEDSNGYAVLNGQTISLYEYGNKTRYRDHKDRWIFLVSDYHKLGFNADETIEFCKLLDEGKLEVTEYNLKKFMRKLRNHPTVLKYR